jgi:hypothetical protein
MHHRRDTIRGTIGRPIAFVVALPTTAYVAFGQAVGATWEPGQGDGRTRHPQPRIELGPGDGNTPAAALASSNRPRGACVGRAGE